MKKKELFEAIKRFINNLHDEDYSEKISIEGVDRNLMIYFSISEDLEETENKISLYIDEWKDKISIDVAVTFLAFSNLSRLGCLKVESPKIHSISHSISGISKSTFKVQKR